MKKTIGITLLFLLTLSILPAFPQNGLKNAKSGDTLTLKCKVVCEYFVNKGGKVKPEIKEYFISTGPERLFVKFLGSKVKPEDLKPLVGKKVLLTFILRDGLWDTDDPYTQSRTGRYVTLLSLPAKK